jgi:mRNA interferase RelE/StbE
VPYFVEILLSAARELSALPNHIQSQVGARIDALRDNPLPPGVQKLHGEDKLYRIRSGDYRIIYEVDHPNSKVTVTNIGHRRDVYRAG